VGKVTSDKMNKTVVVGIDRLVKHPLYKKYIRRTKKLYAHDEENMQKIGDTVESPR
jgi:small subunit ribosomal protein S17